MKRAAHLIQLLLLAGCAPLQPGSQSLSGQSLSGPSLSTSIATNAPPAVAIQWFAAATAGAALCEGAGRSVHAQFERAAVAACHIDADGSIHATIRPEDTPINPSPWYGMVISANPAAETVLTLHYEGGKHRYAPWQAVPGAPAQPLDAARVTIAQDRISATLRLPAAASQLIIAQPLETMAGVLAPFEARVRSGQLVREDAGYSRARRPLAVYVHRPPQPRGTVVLITRQHPPETTGPQAFTRFTDVLLGPSPEATAFRRDHTLIIVPLANPDGFVQGHWRHNLGGVDLNRDWGPFTQPETRALARSISAEAARAPVVAVIDFHSTFRDVVYAPPLPAQPDAGEAMLQAIMPMLAEADVRIDRAHNPGNGTLKSWATDSFGVSALTWEVGDASPLARTDALATAAANALMARTENR